MTTSFKKKVFLFIFCLASITQGMYSTYFVSILTTIESIYQIQSKTAGALLSATEIGQILGSLFIAYYGGRGNKPKWIAACMTLSAIAALISISPHFLLVTLKENQVSGQQPSQIQPIHPLSLDSPNATVVATALASPAYQASDLIKTYQPDLINQSTSSTNHTASIFAPSNHNVPHLCRWESSAFNLTKRADPTPPSALTELNIGQHFETKPSAQIIPVSVIILIFFCCLLAIGFGSTAITTLGIPFIDDIISKEESPLYLGLTIGLKIFGPAFGFLLGSFCIHLDASKSLPVEVSSNFSGQDALLNYSGGYGAWWLGLIIISVPLLVLSIPMYYLSKSMSSNNTERDDFEDITYQAAEDHDIGGSHDFQPHMLALAHDLDVTSSRSCFSSEIDSSSREVLQSFNHSASPQHIYSNYVKNLTLDQPILFAGDKSSKSPNHCTKESENQTNIDGQYRGACLAINPITGLESTSFINQIANQISQVDPDDQPMACMAEHSQRPPPPSSSRSSQISSIESSTQSNEELGDQPDNRPDSKRNKKKRRKKLIALAGLPHSLSRLIKSRLLVLRMLSGILHILPIAGFYTFLPKYLIEQFRVTSSSASAISGLAGILFVGFGAFMGGMMVRVFNVNSRMMTRWIASSALIYALGMIVLMNLGCSNNHIVHHRSHDFMLTDCSISCKCSNAIYDPVCANGTTYISPCLAGCRSHSISEDKIIYDECGCMAKSPTQTNQTLATSTTPNYHVNLNVATQGLCSVDCDNLTWYIIVFSAFTLMHASCEVGSMMFNLRCVRSSDRTLALGLITFASSLFGTIPCSVIYGTIVDLTCVHWGTFGPSTSLADSIPSLDEGSQGACRVYDNNLFRYYLHGLTALVMLIAFIVDCIICRFSEEVDFYDRSDSKADIRLGLKKSTETI